MNMNIRSLIAAATLAFAAMALVVPDVGAATDAEKCEAKKIIASGTYFKCRASAASRYAKNGDEGARDEKYGRCAATLGVQFQKAEDRFVCLADGDRPAIENFLDDSSTSLIGFLADQGPAPYCGGLPATGANRCWDTSGDEIDCETEHGFGQDGQVRAGVPVAYQDNFDGTVTALGTGLVWEKKSDDDGLHDVDHTYPWSGWCTYDPPTSVAAGDGWACMRDSDCPLGSTCDVFDCGVFATNPCTPSTDGQGGQDTAWDWLDRMNGAYGTPFAGHRDWRIPNAIELVTIYGPPALGQGCPIIEDVFQSATCSPGCPNVDQFFCYFDPILRRDVCVIRDRACSCTQDYADYWSSSTNVEPHWETRYGAACIDGDRRSWEATTVRAATNHPASVFRARPKTENQYVRAVRGGYVP